MQWNSETFFDELYARFDHLQDLDSASHAGAFARLSGVKKESKVVELCCGYGRLLIPLTLHQSEIVTGIDQSKALLELARRSATARGIDINLIQADLRYFRGEGQYDFAFIAASSVGFYDDRQDDQLIFDSARSFLPCEGKFLLDQGNRPLVGVMNKEDEEYWFERTAEFDVSTGTLRGEYIYQRKSTGWTRVSPYRIHLYGKSELVEMLSRSGFEDFFFYGDFDGSPFLEESSKRLIVVCRAS